MVLYYLLALLGLRTFLAAIVPMTADEAYHIEWARHLDWCYYDHPGMVAWLMRPFLVMLGENPVSVRAQVLLAGTLVCLVCYRLASEMYPGTRVARKSLFLTGLVPIAAIGSIIVTTDAPLAVFWALGLLFFYRAAERGRIGDWALTGVFVGFAFLSKFLAFGFVPAAVLYLLIPRENRKHLKTPGPWVAAGICAVLFLPVMLWNYGNDWLTFRFNFQLRQGELSFSPSTFLLYAGLQLLLFSPVLLAASAWLFFKGAGEYLKDRKMLFLLLFAGVPLGGFALVSFFREVGAHWTAVALIPLVIFFTRAAEGEKGRTYAAALATAGGLVVLVVVLAMGILIAGPERSERGLIAAGFSERKAAKITAYVFALDEIAEMADALRRDADDGFCATRSYSLSSLLTYHSPDRNHYYLWGSKGVHGRNYDLWDDPAEMQGRTMIFVGLRRRMDEKRIRKMLPHFKSLVIHYFDGDGDGSGELARTLGVAAVRHDAPPSCRAFVVIQGEKFSGDDVE